MILRIKNRIEAELKGYIIGVDKTYSLSKISPLLLKSIREFISRKGKRIRPCLFAIGYLGYSNKSSPGLYRTALSLELLHDFMLVHDDIIDKSDTRRGKPSMHALLNRFLHKHRNVKFSGQDLTIVAGDVMFAMAMHAFLAVKENPKHKEESLKKLLEAAFYTGSGEFIELLYGLKEIDKISINDIYKIYDLKTANYTFASPLVMGATLAGANKIETEKLSKFGISLGRAFQIKDDILGMFASHKEIGKSITTDLQEAKKTILIWYAYKHSNNKNKLLIKRILRKNRIDNRDLVKIRRIIKLSGALDFAKKQIRTLIDKAVCLNKTLKMKPKFRRELSEYSKELLNV